MRLQHCKYTNGNQDSFEEFVEFALRGVVALQSKYSVCAYIVSCGTKWN